MLYCFVKCWCFLIDGATLQMRGCVIHHNEMTIKAADIITSVPSVGHESVETKAD